jgi:hypothetical protein
MDKIVKIQRPTTPADAPLLVWDKDRRFVEYHELTGWMRKQFGNDMIAFFTARRQEGRWVIGDRTTAQDW